MGSAKASTLIPRMPGGVRTEIALEPALGAERRRPGRVVEFFHFPGLLQQAQGDRVGEGRFVVVLRHEPSCSLRGNGFSFQPVLRNPAAMPLMVAAST